MARKYFGTDGVRGRVGEHPLTVDFALRLASSAARVLAPEGGTVLVGKDTRLSGYMFEAALEAGFVAAGVNVMLIGPLPTPGIAYMTQALRVRLRRRHQRLAQSVRRQRHQVLRQRRREALGRDRDAHRAASRRAAGDQRFQQARPRDARRQVAHALPGILHVHGAGPGPDGHEDRDRLRERRRLQGRPAHSRGPRRRDRADRLLAERPQHQPELRLDIAGAVAADGAGRAGAGGHRARRRRRSPGDGRSPRPAGRWRSAALHHCARAPAAEGSSSDRSSAP